MAPPRVPGRHSPSSRTPSDCCLSVPKHRNYYHLLHHTAPPSRPAAHPSPGGRVPSCVGLPHPSPPLRPLGPRNRRRPLPHHSPIRAPCPCTAPPASAAHPPGPCCPRPGTQAEGVGDYIIRAGGRRGAGEGGGEGSRIWVEGGWCRNLPALTHTRARARLHTRVRAHGRAPRTRPARPLADPHLHVVVLQQVGHRLQQDVGALLGVQAANEGDEGDVLVDRQAQLLLWYRSSTAEAVRGGTRQA